MLTKSKKRKGKDLEKFVASEMKAIFGFAYSRADSGSGKYHKEDVTLPDFVPLHIECKNQAIEKFTDWWNQTIYGCPRSKFPVLVYKLNYWKEPRVMMKYADVANFLIGQKLLNSMEFKVILSWKDFRELILLWSTTNKK